jgi:hypothetical protein
MGWMGALWKYTAAVCRRDRLCCCTIGTLLQSTTCNRPLVVAHTVHNHICMKRGGILVLADVRSTWTFLT